MERAVLSLLSYSAPAYKSDIRIYTCLFGLSSKSRCKILNKIKAFSVLLHLNTRVHVKQNLDNFVQTRRGHLSNASSETLELMESISLHHKVKGK
jgi:hypothetical protein